VSNVLQRVGTPGQSLPHLLRLRAEEAPDGLAYRFLVDGDSRELLLTYGDLHRRASAIAAHLRSLGAARERVLLVYPPGLDFVCAWFGCTYAGAVAVAIPPPALGPVSRSVANTTAIARDARSTFVLTLTATANRMADRLIDGSDLKAARWVATDGDIEGATSSWNPEVRPEDLAFLQYTSGSTAAPRGVMVTHGNLIHNLETIRASSFWERSDHGSVSWLPPYHDMGLIGGILAPLYVRVPATIMSPLAFVQRPVRWLRAITRFRAAVSGGPNFGYNLCVRKISAEERSTLDLSEWKVAFNGAEAIDPRTIRAFTAEFAGCGFRPEAFTPCYGLAESTLLVSATPRTVVPRVQAFASAELSSNRVVDATGAPDGRSLVSSGRPAVGTIIVNPETRRPLTSGQIGEIWVTGPSVARGYWNRPDETHESFNAELIGGAGDRYLRTGDLGFLHDGELFVVGRLKDLIIVDGANHHPQDIERTVRASHSALEAADGAAFSIDVDGREALVVVAAVDGASQDEAEELRHVIRTAVAEHHGIRVHDVVIVRPGQLPKTANRKIQRGASRSAYLAGTLEA
jgi:acyl-CoA synthetase (AMP-forming)/AMP-acid ligase II